MKVLALGSPKGGVGKTTSSLYFATRLAEVLGGTRGRAVVGLVDRDENQNLTLSVETEPELLRPGVVLLPGKNLAQEGRNLELVIVDTPPGMTAIKSLREANLIVVPVTPATKDILSLVQYLQNLEAQRVVMNPGMRLLALLPTKVRNTLAHRKRLGDVHLIAAAQRPPLLVLPSVPLRTSIENNDLDASEYDAPTKELITHAQIIPASAAR